MRRRTPLLVLLTTVLFLAPTGRADTIILKSGEKLDGKVVGETPTQYTIDYKAAAGITDTRTVLKTEVDKIEKEQPDEIAWQTLKNLKPGPTSLPAAGYDLPIRQLQYFTTQFPKSPHAAEAAQAQQAFEEEKKRVDAGEVKINGNWLSKEEVQKERYQINGRAIFSYMQELARKNDLVGALNAFDQLEKSYPGSSAYPDAIDLAKQLVEKLRSTADQTLKNWQVQKKERDDATKNMPDAERAQTAAAQKRQEQQFDAALDAAVKGGTKWPPFQRQHEKTLTTIITKVPTELSRLNALPVAKMRQSIQLSEQGRGELAKHNLDAAENTLKDATKLWPVNELAVRLNKEVAEQKKVAKAGTPAPAVATATPAPQATPARPKPTATAAATTTPLPTPVEEPKPFFSTLPGFGVIVAAVLALGFVYFSYKKKKQAAAHDLG
jgi:hypothetical protein